MSTVNVTIRMDKELKQQADELFSDLGMSLSTAFTVFAKQAIREQAIPFTIEREFNTDTINAIKEVEEMKAREKAEEEKSKSGIEQDVNIY